MYIYPLHTDINAGALKQSKVKANPITEVVKNNTNARAVEASEVAGGVSALTSGRRLLG